MKKSVKFSMVFALILIIVFSLSLVIADETNTGDNSATSSTTSSTNSQSAIDKAYECLESKVEDNCDKLSVEEQVFALLSISECEDELIDNSDNEKCWPDGSCKLRETALAVIALDRVNEDTDDAEAWLISKNRSAGDLIWYLQIDTNEKSSCKVSYDDKTYTVEVNENDVLINSGGPCLTLAQGNYWLQVSSPCIGKKFEISCNNDFLTNLLYTKQGSSTIYVSSLTHSAASDGSTEEQVKSYCFGLSSCDYEGSLWTAIALNKKGYDISSYLPYLITNREGNGKYLPNAFLYILTGQDEYLSDLLQQQKSSKYWQAPASPYSKFYDTALSLVSLSDISVQESENARNYLIDVQGKDGCWQSSIRDTAFILYSSWTKTPKYETEVIYCEPSGFYCMSEAACSDAGGSILGNYECTGLQKCCSEPKRQETCLNKGGIICPAGLECSISTISTLDTSECCLGSCETPVEEEGCEDSGYGYICRTDCYDSEIEISSLSDSCDIGVCCGEIPSQPKKSDDGGSWWWLIILLIILIILVVLGIIFKDKIRDKFFNEKSKSDEKPGPKPRPGSMPMRHMIRPRSRPKTFFPKPKPGFRKTTPPPQSRQSLRRKSSPRNKELDETLKKLREMSK